MKFSEEAGAIQRRIAGCPEGVSRRLTAFAALAPSPGQSLLDVGCGGGHLVHDLAVAAGGGGRAVGLDPMPMQIEAARELCAWLDNAELVEGDATGMPFGDGEFHGLTSIQALEYIAEVDRAMAECRRVLKPGGRAVFISVLWDHWRFHGPDPALNDRIHDIWRAHCAHQMLPPQMPERLRGHGFSAVSQFPIGFYNNRLHENAFCYWGAKLLLNFARAHGFSDAEADDWQEQLLRADREGRFGFVSVPVVTTANVGG